MPLALARHDALARAAVEGNRGVVVKMVGDGLRAAFDEPLDALNATLAMQEALIDAGATNGIALQVRCGLHAGAVERRDNDYFGSTLNRAARIMTAAHGGQVLLSQAVAGLVANRLPASVALRDLGSVRLRDLANPEHVYQVVHPKLRQDFPALRSLEATPNNLSQQVSSFIGREREVAEVKELLGKSRLLTLLGVGGIGKTRLSLQVAADVMDDYPDGVWFVELAPLADARLVPQAVASILGVKEEAGRPVVEALLKYVKDRQLLIILDNCEHLVHACAELAKPLLQSGPHVKVLATSREHLHVAGERSYPVPALATPEPQKTITLASLTQYEAAQLFIDRAVAAQPSFQVTHQNVAAISDICHRLDGIPLAIELAAARVRAMSVGEIAARLSNRFRLLAGGDRTALPHQQTLRASIDWSYDLLTEPERALLRRLAVFAGGWTLEAAEAVGAGGEIDESDVLDLLTHLVEKSLVEWEAEGERCRLLETVRQYAQERLDASGEGNEARTRHLAFYLALAEEAMPEARGPKQGAWLARLDVERENLLSAHAWCDCPQVEAELGLRLVFAVAGYWLPRGLLDLGHRVTLEALTRAGAQERNFARCGGLSAAGFLAFFMGRYAEAQGYLQESLAIAREIGHEERIANALRMLGLVSRAQGERTAARCHLEASLALARQLEHKGQLYAVLTALAELHRVEGNLDAAELLYEESLMLARASGDRVYSVDCLSNLAVLSIDRGLGGRARGMLLAALAIVEEIGWKNEGQAVVENSAGLAACLGEWKCAARFYGAAEAQREQMRAHRDPADEAFLTPLIARARAALDAAAFAAAESAGRALSYEEAMGEVRAWLEIDSPHGGR
jgi:predicted ATPase